MRSGALPLLAFFLVSGCSMAGDLTAIKGHIPVCKITLGRIPIGPQEIGNGRQFDKEDFSSRQWDIR
jgi:hypothetical protein